MRDSEYELPGYFPDKFGINHQGYYHSKKNQKSEIKPRNWRIKTLRQVLPEYYHLAKRSKQKKSLFSRKFDKANEEKHIEAYIASFLKGQIISKFNGETNKEALLNIQIVKNDDNTSRFICYNYGNNKLFQGGAPLLSVEEAIQRIIKSGARYFGKIDLKKGFFNLLIHALS